MLARNEIDRDYACNRALFKRVRTGFYQLNPQLKVRRGSGEHAGWVNVFDALNLPLIHDGALPLHRGRIDDYRRQSGLPIPSAPIAGPRNGE